MSNKFLLDLPEKIENDAIGYEVYVDDVIDSVKGNAKMIGLLANYGSGKSTIVNMVKEKLKNDNIKFVNVNLWKLENKRNNNLVDDSIAIHKFFLNRLMRELPEGTTKEYLKNKIDSKYSLFNISMKNKGDLLFLLFLFGIFIFNIILKLDIIGFTMSSVGTLLIDLFVALGVVVVLSHSKLYFSFSKDSSVRKINESDTCECFNEIINKIQKVHKYDSIIICIEDIDRYDDPDFVIRLLEQIYKFYIEYDERLRVKFLVSLKPPYMLAKDEENVKELTLKYKNIYEKIFDIIINLQSVSIQNYSAVLIELMSVRMSKLNEMGLFVPNDDKSLGSWSYLYYGNSVSIRDIKHRFNYFMVLYENLWNHKSSLNDNSNLFEISLDTCLLVAYLEDAYSSEFYALINDSSRFEMIVSEYLFNKEYIEPSDNKDFNEEFSKALENGLIKADYTMYFYKYPKKLIIKNIFNNSIENAIFTDSKKGIKDFDLYCKSASSSDIKEAIKRKFEFSGIPNIIFENKKLYDIAKEDYFDDIIDFLEAKFIFSAENGIKNMYSMIPKLFSLNDSKLLDNYIELLFEDLHNNFEDKEILIKRVDLIKKVGLCTEFKALFNNNMPLITLDEAKCTSDANVVLKLVAPLKVDRSIIDVLSYIEKTYSIDFNQLADFFDNMLDVEDDLFELIFNVFNYNSYNKSQKYLLYKMYYQKLQLDDIHKLKKVVLKLNVLPVFVEKKIVVKMISLSDATLRKDFERTYVDILLIVNKITNESQKAINQFKYYYTYNNLIEEQLYDKGLYIYYVYSNYKRLNKFSYEEDKFEKLKRCYLNFFNNHDIAKDKFYIDYKIQLYIKANSNYDKLNFKKIFLLLDAPQNVVDLNVIFSKTYKEPTDADLDIYLTNIKEIDNNCENEFIDYIIDAVKNKNMNLSIGAYNSIKKIINKKNMRRFQHIKSLCK